MQEELYFFLSILSALIMGAAIGAERQFRQHTAGLRTNALVCVGAALFVSLSRLIDKEGSPTRIAGQVVSGIGFLGGGVILREGFNVRGMNTAATLWCSAAIGTLAGSGFILHAGIGTIIVLFVHIVLRPVVRFIDVKSKTAQDVDTLYKIQVVCADSQESMIRMILLRHVNAEPSSSIQGITKQDNGKPDTTCVVAEVHCTMRNDKFLNELVSRVSIEPSVSNASWERVQ